MQSPKVRDGDAELASWSETSKNITMRCREADGENRLCWRKCHFRLAVPRYSQNLTPGVQTPHRNEARVHGQVFPIGRENGGAGSMDVCS